MKTIQMTVDESLLAEMDRATADLNTSRSACIRAALRLALQQHLISKLEKEQADGYARHPVTTEEFGVWDGEEETLSAVVAGSLLDSLDQTVDDDAEVAWEKEIVLRLRETDEGEVKLVP
jgi:Arc/MetJ-type ribon-helix-helix transcriptional regulator